MALRILALGSDVESQPPASVLSVGLGGSYCAPGTARALEQMLGAPVTIGYGTTELGGPVLMSTPVDSERTRWATIGRPLAGVEVRLASTTGLGHSPSEDGVDELKIRSPSLAVLRGRHGDALRPIETDDDGYFGTGDRARRLSDGTFEIQGRLDSMISRGGVLIDPARIEAVLTSVPGVVIARVSGRPSRVDGEQDIEAEVVVDASVEATLRLSREECRRQLPPLLVPRILTSVSSIPTVADGSPVRW